MNQELGLQLFEFSKMGNLNTYVNYINPNVKLLGIDEVINYDNNLEQYELNDDIVQQKLEIREYTNSWDNSNLNKYFNNIRNKNIFERLLDKFNGWLYKDNVQMLDKGKEDESINNETNVEDEKKTDNISALSEEELSRYNEKMKQITREYKENSKENDISKTIDNDYDIR